jgi:uncharacterized membrane protein
MSRFWLPLRVVRGHPRLFAGMAVSFLAGVLLPDSVRLATRLLIAWNAGTWFYFIAAGIMIARGSPQSIRRRARTSDEGKFFILVLTSLAAIAAIAAIIAQLAIVKDLSGTIKGLHIALAAATIISACFIHLTYGRPTAERGGLVFPGTKNPGYFDFLYFSYVIGVACQTADVNITSQAMRRVALVHCVLAFFFNSAVLALTINIAAGLI